MLKEYLVEVEVRRARGRQSFTVQAHSEADALARWICGEGSCIHEEFEADAYGMPEIQENK